ncbi:MAG: DUF4868 domain-containing protein [Prevotella sp.]|nr:DUF4868 domain-containing protein [Prevotella sp.]
MDYLIAKTKGKRGSFYKVLSDQTTFEDIPDFANSREYDDEYKLQEGEWFVVEQFSQQSYCLDLLKNNFVATNYSFMPKEKYGKIDFIVSVQNEGNDFIFQKITPSYIYEKQKLLSWEHINAPTDQAVLSNHRDVLVIKEGADCYYKKDADKLYFKNLTSITSIFDGINILYREATNQEVEEFLKMDMINVADGFTKDDVKTANRRRIKEASERYRSFSPEQKAKIPSYISKYCPHIYDETTSKFNVDDENNLTDLLNVLNQRYYTTEIDDEKRLANSVTKL